MRKEYESFLAKILGRKTYEGFGNFPMIILLIYTVVIFVFYFLSKIVYWSFIADLLSMVVGTIITFVLYLGCLIVKLDIFLEKKFNKVDEENNERKKNIHDKKSAFLGCVILVTGIVSVFVTENYSDSYTFNCTEFRVDETKGVYHLFRNCENIDWDSDLTKLKGYQIESRGYELCHNCELTAEDYDGDFDEGLMRP